MLTIVALAKERQTNQGEGPFGLGYMKSQCVQSLKGMCDKTAIILFN